LRKLMLLSALVLATATAVSVHAQPPTPGKNEILVHNSSSRALWITIYLTPKRGEKKAFGCAAAGSTLTLTARIFVTRPEYWPHAELKEHANDCNGATTRSWSNPKTTSANLWIVPQYRDKPDSMPMITDRNPF